MSSVMSRSRYEGKLHGLMKEETEAQVTEKLIRTLAEKDEEKVSKTSYIETMWTATALIVSSEGCLQ